jgi:hypothetical protein
MFPGGAAGWGLLLLRMCAAGMLFRNSVVDDGISVPTWEIAGVILLVTAFCVGVFTPVSCVLSAAMQIFLVLHAQESDAYHIVFTLFSFWGREHFRLIPGYLAAGSLSAQAQNNA